MKNTIGIIGLGYVGLPLAVAIVKKYQVIGFDINKKRISELNSGLDSTNELTNEEVIEKWWSRNNIDVSIVRFYSFRFFWRW